VVHLVVLLRDSVSAVAHHLLTSGKREAWEQCFSLDQELLEPLQRRRKKAPGEEEGRRPWDAPAGLISSRPSRPGAVASTASCQHGRRLRVTSPSLWPSRPGHRRENRCSRTNWLLNKVDLLAAAPPRVCGMVASLADEVPKTSMMACEEEILAVAIPDLMPMTTTAAPHWNSLAVGAVVALGEVILDEAAPPRETTCGVAEEILTIRTHTNEMRTTGKAESNEIHATGISTTCLSASLLPRTSVGDVLMLISVALL